MKSTNTNANTMDQIQVQNEEYIPIAHAHEHEDSPTHTTTPASATQSQSQSQSRSRTQIPWQDRLTALANLASTSLGPDSKDHNSSPRIHHHLDAIESILRDPNPTPTPTPDPAEHHSLSIPKPTSKSTLNAYNPDDDPTRRRRTSYRTKSLLGDRSASELEEPDWLVKTQLLKETKIVTSLDGLLGEVSFLNGQISRRREESVRIQEIWEERERGYRRVIGELGDEVDELRGDLVEDAVELEGIQGTIQGLQNWIEGITIMMRDSQKEKERNHHLVQVRSKRTRWGRTPEARNDRDLNEISGDRDHDGEIVLEGLSAWMRGWRDVEDGFQARAQGRKMKREQRRDLLLKRNSTDVPVSLPGPGRVAPVQVLG
ncbi:hypothetical protein N7478_012546 [Penicillium angulare]|uniref:uncharacterized protein n=1 Tax=Penicillium angulare TaxID=116970 RepID=UPI0025405B79|nr:uncharacterized protein N7478_012546 [Penicillium angulare]KAJ5259565.1 hypothetical protein N7478_012546 [Penicillium angulare]